MKNSFDKLYPKVKDSQKSRKYQFQEILRRITGISIPIFGISWNPPTSEREIIRELLVFLEDRRVLYYPEYIEHIEWCTESVLKIRSELTACLQKLDNSSKAIPYIRTMRAACRQYLDRYDPDSVSSELLKEVLRKLAEYDIVGTTRAADFFTNLGEIRASFGINLSQLCVIYGLDIEGELASIFPPEDKDANLEL